MLHFNFRFARKLFSGGGGGGGGDESAAIFPSEKVSRGGGGATPENVLADSSSAVSAPLRGKAKTVIIFL